MAYRIIDERLEPLNPVLEVVRDLDGELLIRLPAIIAEDPKTLPSLMIVRHCESKSDLTRVSRKCQPNCYKPTVALEPKYLRMCS